MYRKWHSCDPFVLFDLDPITKTPPDKQAITSNLFNEAKKVDTLVIWTDCDREGEHIGAEIAKVCKRAKSTLIVRRARFSAIIAQCVYPVYFVLHLTSPQTNSSCCSKSSKPGPEAR